VNTELLTRIEAARFLQATYRLRVTNASLATMATRGGGPRFIKQGRYAYYIKVHLAEWAEARFSGILDSTSTPHHRNAHPFFQYQPDYGDLPNDTDPRMTGDARFDEIACLLDEELDGPMPKDKIFQRKQIVDTL
jgi:hypothetical protein